MKKVYEEENIRAIAEKIREKTGESISYRVAQMPEGIEKVYNEGKAQGSGGYDIGYEDGKKSEYDAFWDVYQENGNRTKYNYGFFGKGWTNENFKPKYPIIMVGDGSYVFSDAAFDNFDFVENGIILDTSGATTLTYCFRQSKVSRLGTIDCRNCTNLNRLFYGCSVVTIDNFIVKESVTYDNTFVYANRLENIKINGVIGNNISFKDSTKLSHDSLMSIIGALKDLHPSKTLTYSYGNFGECVIEGFYTDPKGIEFYVTSAVLNGMTLVCQSKYNNYENEPCDVTITVTNIDISQEDVTKIKSIKQNVIDYTPETGFITDVVIKTKDKASEVKTLTLGTANLAKLSEEEKAMATDKGWELT